MATANLTLSCEYCNGPRDPGIKFRGEDLSGKPFELLTVNHLLDVHRIGKQLYYYWCCRCICGQWSVVRSGNLTSRHASSCGCRKRQVTGARARTHGLSKTREYKIWSGMVQRCCNHRNPDYHAYGERGITICARWRSDFLSFLKDMGKAPSNSHSIERKDVNGSYCKENCCWATSKEQCNNTRRNIFITYKGLRMNLMQLSETLHINYFTLRNRYQRGWSIERMAEAPTKKGKASC